MNKKEKDIALFVAFCIEEYGAAKGIPSFVTVCTINPLVR